MDRLGGGQDHRRYHCCYLLENNMPSALTTACGHWVVRLVAHQAVVWQWWSDPPACRTPMRRVALVGCSGFPHHTLRFIIINLFAGQHWCWALTNYDSDNVPRTQHDGAQAQLVPNQVQLL